MLRFTPQLEIHENQVPFKRTRSELLASPSLFSASLDFAQKRARGALEGSLQGLLSLPSLKAQLKQAGPEHFYVDSWVNETHQGEVPSPFGLHNDGAPKINGQAALDRLGKNGNVRVWLVLTGDGNGRSCPLFVNEPIDINEASIDPKAVWTSLHKNYFRWVAEAHITHRCLPYGAIAAYNGNTLHTALPTQTFSGEPHLRLLTRISYLPEQSPQLNRVLSPEEIPIHHPFDHD